MDDPSTVCRYDERVANHRAVKEGDAVVIRSRDAVLGASVITRIEQASGRKQVQECPECQSVDIKLRRSRGTWRCRHGHVFAEPVQRQIDVRTYAAHYGDSFAAARPF